MAAPAPVYAEAGRRGLLIPLDPFRARVGGELALRRVLGALTVTEKPLPGRPRGAPRAQRRAYQVVREGGHDLLRLPRAKAAPFLRARGAPLLDGVRAAPDALPEPRRLAPARCEPSAPLYDYQEAAVAHLCGPGPLGPERVAAHCAVAYLQMDTGLGKTRVAAAVIARRGEPALVVVPTLELANQWLDELAELYPGLAAAVYHNPPRGARRPAPGPRTHDVVVVVVNTLRAKPPAFLEGYGTLVLDEAHEYQSPCNGAVLWLAQTRAVLGLSATPEDRPDGLDKYVALHLGLPLRAEKIPGFDAGAVRFRGEVRVVKYAGEPAHCETATTPAGTASAIGTIANIIQDPARMRAVAAEVVRLYRLHRTAAPAELARLGLGPRPAAAATPTHPAGEVRRHGVFVFAEHRDYLLALRAAIWDQLRPEEAAEVAAPELEEGGPAPGAPGPSVSVLRGGVSRGDVARVRRTGAHIVITTYGFSRRGISLADMTALVVATPRRNGMNQIVGRVLRRGSDESILRQVVDFVDVRTGLKSQIADRRKVYRAKGYPISKTHASWEDYPGPPEAGGEAAGPEESLAAIPLEDLLAAAAGTPKKPGGLPCPTALTAEELDELLGL